jgi:hypothetical protein
MALITTVRAFVETKLHLKLATPEIDVLKKLK